MVSTKLIFGLIISSICFFSAFQTKAIVPNNEKEIILTIADEAPMSIEGFLSEIRLFSGSYAPRGWAFCEGQTLSVSMYQSLYSLLFTTHGGDGRTNFKLPDLRKAEKALGGNRYIICTQGEYPMFDNGGTSGAISGEIRLFTSGLGKAPAGWKFCDGQTLQTTGYNSLFGVIATRYGVDGRGTFKLPDLREEEKKLDNVRYIICTNGERPKKEGTETVEDKKSKVDQWGFPVQSNLTQMYAEVRLFAGSFAPKGWIYCEGQVWSIMSKDPTDRERPNESLFLILGTTYGGDGRKTFGIPNLGTEETGLQGVRYIFSKTGVYPSRS